jgi:hypothetical protein
MEIKNNYQQLSNLKEIYREHKRLKYSEKKKAEYIR